MKFILSMTSSIIMSLNNFKNIFVRKSYKWRTKGNNFQNSWIFDIVQLLINHGCPLPSGYGALGNLFNLPNTDFYHVYDKNSIYFIKLSFKLNELGCEVLSIILCPIINIIRPVLQLVILKCFRLQIMSSFGLWLFLLHFI